MSLYLKYRPKDFHSLVGQEFTKSTLQKAISEDKTVGAYLFCGPRGTGKTSSARIFAKTINCLNIQDGNPCLSCKVCLDFLDEKLIDIIEIDAASHTGVDNIREIIERAQFAPTYCKYKIYIIDEVHMLSKGAFNALLKILEEPPEHVKFILATTETHKVPDTIISRCQRYDFKRISSQDITKRLQFIAQNEDITIDDQSLEYITKNSGGGLRNAISLFEQLIQDGKIDFSTVIDKLGIVHEELLESFLSQLILKDQSIISEFDSLVDEGKNIKLFFKELIFYTKNKALGEIKKGNSISQYIEILDKLDETYGKTKNSLDENTTFIIGILKIITNYTTEIQTSTAQNSNLKNIKTSNISETLEKKSTPTSTQNNQADRDFLTEKGNVESLSSKDAEHIFGSTDIVENKEDDPISSSSENVFNSSNFITELKKIGAKGALTMALRGSGLELIGNTLIIRTKTKIALGQVTNTDNIGLMNKALSNLGINDSEIKPT